MGECEDTKKEIKPTITQCLAKNVVKALNFASRKAIDFPSLRQDLCIVDFGEVFVGFEHTRLVKLINHGDYELEFGTKVLTTLKDPPESFTLTPSFGKVSPLKDIVIKISFKPEYAYKLPAENTNFLGVIGILNGPAFIVDLRGQITPYPVEIHPTELNFGPQFTVETGLGVITKKLTISNKSQTKPIYVAFLSSTLTEFECSFTAQMIEPLAATHTNVTFYPTACQKYEGTLNFQINETVNFKIAVKGRGAKIEMEVVCGSLLIIQETDAMKKPPTKIGDSKRTNPSLVNLGSLKSNQRSRRNVTIINKSPVPFTIMGASILPKSKKLNEVQVDITYPKEDISDILSLKFLHPLPFGSKGKKEKTILQSNLEKSRLDVPDAITEIELFFTPRGQPVDPFSEEVLLKLCGKNNPDRCIWTPGFTILGSCVAVDVRADTLLVNFGSIVIGSSLSKYIAVLNHGNKLAR